MPPGPSGILPTSPTAATTQECAGGLVAAARKAARPGGQRIVSSLCVSRTPSGDLGTLLPSECGHSTFSTHSHTCDDPALQEKHTAPKHFKRNTAQEMSHPRANACHTPRLPSPASTSAHSPSRNNPGPSQTHNLPNPATAPIRSRSH